MSTFILNHVHTTKNTDLRGGILPFSFGLERGQSDSVEGRMYKPWSWMCRIMVRRQRRSPRQQIEP